VRQIERAETWLERHPHDGALLLTLGKLCARQGLWGKAESYLEAALSVEPTYAGHLELARLHERLGNAEAARRHYASSLDLALGALGQNAMRASRAGVALSAGGDPLEVEQRR
jgi:HemY protein